MFKALASLAFLAVAAPASASWREARSAHFIIYSEDKPENLRAFATELERYDAAMRVLRGLKPTTDSPSNRLTIFQVSNILAVQKALGKGSANVAGFYEGRAGNSIAFVPRKAGSGSSLDVDSETVLLHEYAHHFLYRNYPSAFPIWFTEGYAEFNSTARFVADGSVDLGLPARHRSVDLLYFDSIPTSALMQADTKRVGGAALYGQGWLTTHYLSFAKERAGQLGEYLAAINEGKSSIDAANAAFGDLTKLDKELARYKLSRMTYLRVPARTISIAPIEIIELSPGANAIMPVMMRSRRGVDDKTAKDVVKDARAAAAPYPDDPFVQLALAEAEIDASNLDAADKAADRVLAVEPGSVRAMLFKGRVAMERAEAAKSATADDWKAVRRWFVKANRTEPGAPLPLLDFYRSFATEGVEPTANAIDGLRVAAALAPEDDGVRLMLGHQYLKDGKGPEAREVLSATAYSPHGGKVAAFAGKVVAAIDSGGAKAGLAAWDEKPAEENEKPSKPTK